MRRANENLCASRQRPYAARLSADDAAAAQLPRRDFLWQFGGGLGGIALAQLLGQEGLLAAEAATGAGTRSEPDLAGGVHHRAKAKRVVQLFMSGAASQCDTFDYKPELIRRNGQPFDPGEKVELFQSDPGECMQSPWAWRQYGQCGKWISDLVPHLADCVDDIAFIHSMVSKSNVHGPATFMQNSGFVLPGFPAMGAWLSYGLGSMTSDLPTFVVLPDSRGFAPNGPGNWTAGFLPAAHQGTMIRPGAANPIADLFPPSIGQVHSARKRSGGAGGACAAESARTRRRGRAIRSSKRGSAPTSWRRGCRSSAPKCSTCRNENCARRWNNTGSNDPVTEDFGRNCLVARRLLERGVRFVQVWSGADNGFPRRNWDSHEDIARDHADDGAQHGPAGGGAD